MNCFPHIISFITSLYFSCDKPETFREITLKFRHDQSSKGIMVQIDSVLLRTKNNLFYVHERYQIRTTIFISGQDFC